MDTEEIFQKNEAQSSNSVHLNFSNRQKNLFAELDKAEQNVKTKIGTTDMVVDKNDMVLTTNKRKRSETKHLRGKESIFKKPEEPLSKCLPLRTAPDFKRNPHKWKKYSLSDVKYEDLTDKSNTSAALSFLRELEERKQVESDEPMETDSKIVFKKRNGPKFNKSAIIKTQIDETNEEKSSFKGSKIVMPEYIVGQKIQKEKKNKITKDKSEKNKEIKLDHLLEEDE